MAAHHDLMEPLRTALSPLRRLFAGRPAARSASTTASGRRAAERLGARLFHVVRVDVEARCLCGAELGHAVTLATHGPADDLTAAVPRLIHDFDRHMALFEVSTGHALVLVLTRPVLALRAPAPARKGATDGAR